MFLAIKAIKQSYYAGSLWYDLDRFMIYTLGLDKQN